MTYETKYTHSYLLSEQAKGSEGDWHDLCGLDEAHGKAKNSINNINNIIT